MKHERWNSRAIMWPCKDCGCEVAPVRNGKRHTWGVNDKLWKQAGMKLQKAPIRHRRVPLLDMLCSPSRIPQGATVRTT